MLPCDRCGQPATLRLAEAGVESWTCTACAEDVAGDQGIATLAGLLMRPQRRNGICPNCGANQVEAEKTGLVGCPLCYVAFGEAIWRVMGAREGKWSRADLW